MPMYLTKANYHAAGVQGLIKEGAAGRRATVTKMIEQSGGKVHGFYFALGETDLYVISEYSDRAAALGLSMAVNASGATSVTQVELIPVEEVDAAIKKIPAYRAPGA
jgi:uncharacterized protein with GYD domain